jgi:VWFA-related protein
VKRFLTTLLIALATAGGWTLLAQQDPQEQELEPISNFVESIDVSIVNVEVMVSDKKGNPIQGLTKDDFEVFDNGRPQPITNFYEVKGRRIIEQKPDGNTVVEEIEETALPSEVPERLQRRYVFFVDNLSLAPFNRQPVFAEMKTFVDENLLPGDLAMIVTFNRDIKVRVPFTDDHRFIKQTFDTIAEENAFGLQNLSERRQAESQIREADTYEEAVGVARTFAYSVEHDLRTAISAMKGLMTTLAGVDGRKIMVITSEGLPIQPGRELFYYVDELAVQKGWRATSSVYMEATHFDSKLAVESLAHSANANGITLYLLHAGGLSAASVGSSAESSAPIPPVVSTAALSNSTESMNLLAYMTGGLATVGTNNFSGAFDRIEADVNSYYSLGYRAGAERVDRQRRIEVRAKNKDYRVRSRRSLIEKSVYTELTDRVIANLFYKDDDNNLGIAMRTETAKPVEANRFIIPVEIRIPMDRLAFIPTGEVARGGFSVFVVVADEQQDMSDVQRMDQSIVLDLEELGKINGKYYTYRADLLMNKGRNTISVAVLDEASQMTGYAVQQVLAYDLR